MIKIQPIQICSPGSVSLSLQKGFADLKIKLPFDIPWDELLQEFGFDLYIDDDPARGGYFSSYFKEIMISLSSEDYERGAFCHEFSHLLQHMYNKKQWPDLKNNLTFSEVWFHELEADCLSLAVWDWLFPGIPYSKHLGVYFKQKGFDFLKKYSKPYCEFDMKDFGKII